jgi:nicotinate-nucleotide adenylyltransferase
MSEPTRIALYGGTFDPIHRGHVETVLAAREALGWNRVWIIPAATQPFKRGVASSSAFHRYAMAVLATLDHPLFRISPVELERGSISYTVDTLRQFRREAPDAVVDWIIGEDNLAQLPQWRDVEELFRLANFVVLRRGVAAAVPASLSPLVVAPRERGHSGGIVIAPNSRVEISATDIRRRVGRGDDLTSLVDPRVARYIEAYRLYREDV